MPDRKDEGIPLDGRFDVAFADELAHLESYNKHLYRPNTYLHKWWARRCGSTFRAILKHLVRDESRQDYYSPGGLEGKIILDPMAGGGTTLHEAIRLGANVIGADIDPIPLLQARATLSQIPLPRLQDAFTHFHDQLYTTMAPYYGTACPFCLRSLELRYILFGLRRRCGCQEAIFVDSLILRHNNDGSIIHLCPETHNIYRDDQLVGRATTGQQLPIMERTTNSCNQCGEKYREALTIPYYQRYVPVAVVSDCEEHGLVFSPPSQIDLSVVAEADGRRPMIGLDASDFKVVGGPKSRSLIDRGIDSYLDLFSSRQLIFLQKSIELLAPLDPLLRLNLSLLVSTSLEFNSMLCGYKGQQKRRPGTIKHTFYRHAYTFPYTALENNPVIRANVSGSLQNLFRSRIVRGRTFAANPIERRVDNGAARKVFVEGETDAGIERSHFSQFQDGSQQFLLLQGSSSDLDLPDNSVDFIVTDPPYFDSVQYSDLAAFFRVWLKQMLPQEARWDYAQAESAVGQHAKGNGQFTAVLSDIFSECRRVLKPGGRLVFTFHHWNPKGWTSLTLALKRAGFVLTNRYAVHAENKTSVHIANQNALLHDVILVLAPKDSQALPVWKSPKKIENTYDQTFCRQCGAAVGWMLNQPMNDLEIEEAWQSLLV